MYCKAAYGALDSHTAHWQDSGGGVSRTESRKKSMSAVVWDVHSDVEGVLVILMNVIGPNKQQCYVAIQHFVICEAVD